MNTPQTRPTPIEAVQEFGQLKAQKFAELLQHRTERLSKRAKYLALMLFLISSLSAITYLLSFNNTSMSSLPDQLPATNMPYFPDLENGNTRADSLTHQSLKLQTNKNHD